MGLIHHHAIVATTSNREHFKELMRWSTISGVQGRLIFTTSITLNGYQTAVMVPDGSKEYRVESDSGDQTRAKFLDWLRKQNEVDGHWDWVEVGFGELGAKVVKTNCRRVV